MNVRSSENGFLFCHYKLIIAKLHKNFKKKSQEKYWWYVSEHSLCCFTRVHDFSLHASQKLHGHGKIDRKAGRHTHKQTHRLNYRPRLINTYICCLFLENLSGASSQIRTSTFHSAIELVSLHTIPLKKKEGAMTTFQTLRKQQLSALCAKNFGLSQQSFTNERGQRVGCDQHQDV